MNEDFVAAMRRATQLTRGSNVAEATHVIQDALMGRGILGEQNSTVPEILAPVTPSTPKPFQIDPDADVVEPSERSTTPLGRPGEPLSSNRWRKPLGETVRILREGRLAANALGPFPDTGPRGLAGRAAPLVLPQGAQFLARQFTCTAGARHYRLYVPASAPDQPHGLVVMLHGCKQNPEDFAAGTNMNAVAEKNGLLVAYPQQTGIDNASSCWNWFRPGDQRRDSGEPSIIAGITREIMSEFALERRQVFIAGLSAGGAMAAVMGETYPDIYAGVGIHSGLAYGSANDVMTAFSAMRGDASYPARIPSSTSADASVPTRTIVFHGTADRTVHPSNAERIVSAATLSRGDTAIRESFDDSGRTWTRKVFLDPTGSPMVEQWLVDGAGHAWFGGRPAGSYTDPKGPDASSEMVRFFMNADRALDTENANG
ncbi:MAG: extracellular catalytic domain type 1 short-chain-length polyhydroxyalkanoate depolymerase [Neoaquamicrobium sediminum]|uniref:extracellular catalytic domain type 1 short-chain-length polyhydroxyalkanoate depolymerase n=1 Tax=Neoaquamicrobium sediminum TaxID=1849104 RepID=UPI0040383341